MKDNKSVPLEGQALIVALKVTNFSKHFSGRIAIKRENSVSYKSPLMFEPKLYYYLELFRRE